MRFEKSHLKKKQKKPIAFPVLYNLNEDILQIAEEKKT